ncbi:hypothetical protein OVA11_19210 [Caulobacter sp. SL161]|uniref:hypothetical protein n=1 Tax=Caulobacter sp. SL161 TaxID=2995156 RepID=UPI0022749AA3|nr:hypothetical protein [Caulobacter sp. SL161]MCY1649108.1 hypothetical protein [Caulobacter sp. SL161]
MTAAPATSPAVDLMAEAIAEATWARIEHIKPGYRAQRRFPTWSKLDAAERQSWRLCARHVLTALRQAGEMNDGARRLLIARTVADATWEATRTDGRPSLTPFPTWETVTADHRGDYMHIAGDIMSRVRAAKAQAQQARAA